MKIILIVATWTAVVLQALAVNYHTHHQDYHHSKPHIPILKSHSSSNSHDGSYEYAYKAGNGIQMEEEGYIKNSGHKGHEIQVAHGKYSYIDPKGEKISVSYIADENGFQPKGAHFPTPPTAHKESHNSHDSYYHH